MFLAEIGLPLLVGNMAVLHAAAADGTAPQSPLDYFLQYGVLGLVLIGFVTGWIVPGYQAKQLLEENKRLTALVEGKVFPMLETTGTTLDKASSAMEKATTAFERALDRAESPRGAGS